MTRNAAYNEKVSQNLEVSRTRHPTRTKQSLLFLVLALPISSSWPQPPLFLFSLVSVSEPPSQLVPAQVQPRLSPRHKNKKHVRNNSFLHSYSYLVSIELLLLFKYFCRTVKSSKNTPTKLIAITNTPLPGTASF